MQQCRFYGEKDSARAAHRPSVEAMLLVPKAGTQRPEKPVYERSESFQVSPPWQKRNLSPACSSLIGTHVGEEAPGSGQLLTVSDFPPEEPGKSGGSAKRPCSCGLPDLPYIGLKK